MLHNFAAYDITNLLFSFVVLAQPSFDRLSPARINEGELVPRVICFNNNFNQLVDTLIWVHPNGITLTSILLPLFTARREAARDYKCVMTGSNQERVVVFTLIVQCK